MMYAGEHPTNLSVNDVNISVSVEYSEVPASATMIPFEKNGAPARASTAVAVTIRGLAAMKASSTQTALKGTGTSESQTSRLPFACPAKFGMISRAQSQERLE